jgi:predicted amidophosphoribosyltransferase
LVRVRSTTPLKALSAKARHAEVSGAFKIRSRRAHLVKDARVVLIDDVMTSGATVTACTNALTDAGAASVDVVAMARTTRPDIGSALELSSS